MRGARLLAGLLRRVARRGRAAAPARPSRRRLVLLQIDGLSAGRLARALADGEMPHLARRLRAGTLRMRRAPTAIAPSTPVYQAALLYGTTGGIPGFGWHDRALGRTVRMDLADDVLAVERDLERAGGPGLLDGGVSYGTIFTGRAREAFFNVVRWGGLGDDPPRAAPRNRYDLVASLVSGALSGAHVAARIAVELADGAWDLARSVRENGTARLEWRFLVMRTVFAAVLRHVQTHGVVLDVLRGVPVVYADFLAYDEVAHRRGPDSRRALRHLRNIDGDIAQVMAAVEEVPEYGYEVLISSDHGQSASVPFEMLLGEDPAEYILRHALGRERRGATVDADRIRDLLKVRSLKLWARAQRRPLRALLAPWIAWVERRAEGRLRAQAPACADVEVVTGGTIAHVYLTRDATPLALHEIERRWPELVPALARCPGVGYLLARDGDDAAVFFHGLRVRLGARSLAAIAPPGVDPALFRRHLADAVASPRAGDLVLFGARAPAGNVAFDFEFGSHGGVHPDELDTFWIHPPEVPLPADGEVRPEELYRFFRARYREEP